METIPESALHKASPTKTTDGDIFPRLYEKERWAKDMVITNLSGFEEWEMESMGLRRILSVLPAEKLVLFPDISPTELGLVPTGVLAEFNVERVPNWREHVRGADIGCGMLMTDLGIKSDDFRRAQKELDDLMDKLRQQGLASCFRGNHFINFAADVTTGKVSALIHTGSYGDMQKELAKYVRDPKIYDDVYAQTIDSARATRARILQVVENIYGKGERTYDTIHNTVRVDPHRGVAQIFKGVVEVPRAGQVAILPSSRSGMMVQYRTGVASEVVGGTSHGTGRKRPRSAMKEHTMQEEPHSLEQTHIMMPTGTVWPTTEIDSAYWPIDRSIDLLEKYGIMSADGQRLLQPIAGLKGN